jgi:diguanylate cyclase (GGDEF)-like protein
VGRDFWSLWEAAGRETASSGRERLLSAGRLTNEELVLRRQDGAGAWVLANVSLLPFEEGTQRIEGTIIDITDRKKIEEQILHQAYHDALTGLPNRVLFFDRLSLAIVQARRDLRQGAVIFLDLDRFKQVNDVHGHAAGDDVLVTVGQRIRSSLRQGDSVARLGGDEFVVLLPQVRSREGADRVANKLIAEIEKPIPIPGAHVSISASVGIHLFPTDDEDADVVVTRADCAMYLAKQAGGGRYMFSGPRSAAE